ncbi:MAG TPA: TonB-dependent receptor [Rhizomicrobium sp.]|nr:TonB-dependent receptor [Rhizomicrobium sp.]
MYQVQAARKGRKNTLLLTTALAAGLTTIATSAAYAQQDPNAVEVVTVTGYRGSLQEATQYKRQSVNFTDAIYAEDIGKFPDTNIAESFNRIPGVTISRDVDGEGVNIAIRGLGTNFTKILLNGAQVAVASTGQTDAQNTNREVDLNMFPTELFTSLTVDKTSRPDLVEGGAAGTVNMRSARPFDNPGRHFTFAAQGVENSLADGMGTHDSFIASDTEGKFGILIGGVYVNDQVRTKGFETIGWTNPKLSAAQCGAGNTCDSIGGGNFSIPGTVPANAGNGLVTGATIDEAFLLANNPGLNIQQISNALIPRLGRPMDEFGTRDRYNAVTSLEWRPSDTMHFYVDMVYGHEQNDLQRFDMDFVGRNGATIPLNEKVDVNGVVTSATYANAQFFLEYRPYTESTVFKGINPGMEWQIADNLDFDLQFNYTDSHFVRNSPSVLAITPASSGVTVNYTNNGTLPTFGTNIDLNNPANFGWAGGRVNIQDEERNTSTKGVHSDLTWGGDKINLKVGAAYDDVFRRIKAFDNSQAWQNAVCGDNPSVFVPSPNTQPPCQGLNTPTPGAGYPTYPGLGTGFTAGQPSTFTYQGSLVPQTSLATFLSPSRDGFVTLNFPAFAKASNYSFFNGTAPTSASSNTSANAGLVQEKTTGLYAELNGEFDIDARRLRYNIGSRWIQTDQTIGGFVTIANPLNVGLLDGGKYPNALNFVDTHNTYRAWLPSFNAVYEVADDFQVRGSVSRTMTRPNPNAMLPGLNFSDPSAATGTIGNPALAPYFSNNIDLGAELYTGKEGYIGVAVFRKGITGYTINGNTTVPFSALAAYGVTYGTLNPTQQAAINSRGGPGSANVTLTEQVNGQGLFTVNGIEADLVQPFDFLTSQWGITGAGFDGNITILDPRAAGASVSANVGIAPFTYNLALYYEQFGFSGRISYVFNKGTAVSQPGQNGLTAAAIFQDDYGQADASFSYDLNKIFADVPGDPQLTLDLINITDTKIRQYFEYKNATYTDYDPGRTILFGIRAKF